MRLRLGIRVILLALLVLTGRAEAAAKRVVLLVNGTLGDKSFLDSAARGMQLIREKYRDAVRTRIIEMSYDQSKWQATVEDVAEQDWDLIISGTYQMPDILAQVAPGYPGKRFILFDATMDYSTGHFGNIHSIGFRQNESSYLAGLLGEAMIKASGHPDASLGFLGGTEDPVIDDFLVGYVAGARAVDPKAKIAVAFVGSFDDAAKGKELALAQYRSGVAIGFNVAGQAGLGQLAAARESGRLAIGVDSDQSAIFARTDPDLAGHVVTSVLKRVDVSLLLAFDLLEHDALPFGRAVSVGLKEGAVGLADNEIYRSTVPGPVRARVAAAQVDIIAGRIQVPSAFGMSTHEIDALRDEVRP